MKRRNNNASVRRGCAHCISNTKEARVGGFQVQRQPELHSEKPCFKMRQKGRESGGGGR